MTNINLTLFTFLVHKECDAMQIYLRPPVSDKADWNESPDCL